MPKQASIETPTFIVSYPYLSKVDKFDKYGLDAIFSTDEGTKFYSEVLALAMRMLAENFPGREHLFSLENIMLKDGNTNFNKSTGALKNGYANTLYRKFSTEEKIGVVQYDAALQSNVLIDPKLVFSGCYCRAIVQIWIQDSHEWGKKVNVKLEAVQKVADGVSLGGAVPLDAVTAFSAVPEIPPGGVAPGSSGLQTKHAPEMLAAAQGVSYAACIAAGWTDNTLLANGMIAPVPVAPVPVAPVPVAPVPVAPVPVAPVPVAPVPVAPVPVAPVPVAPVPVAPVPVAPVPVAPVPVAPVPVAPVPGASPFIPGTV